MPQALDKIRYLSQKKKERELTYLIEVDGGINAETGLLAKEAGAEILVAGTYIFKAENRRAAVESLKSL